MIRPAKIQVRFSDLDILGHVNNNIYFSYFEMARIYYFKQLVGEDWDWRRLGFVLVKNEIEYLQSVLMQHEPEITVFLEAMGTKSFTLDYELKVGGELFAKGRSVQVCFDATKNQTIAVPQEMRDAFAKISRA